MPICHFKVSHCQELPLIPHGTRHSSARVPRIAVSSIMPMYTYEQLRCPIKSFTVSKAGGLTFLWYHVKWLQGEKRAIYNPFALIRGPFSEEVSLMWKARGNQIGWAINLPKEIIIVHMNLCWANCLLANSALLLSEDFPAIESDAKMGTLLDGWLHVRALINWQPPYRQFVFQQPFKGNCCRVVK